LGDPVAGDVVDEGGHVATGAVDPVEQRGEGWPVRVGGHGGVLLVTGPQPEDVPLPIDGDAGRIVGRRACRARHHDRGPGAKPARDALLARFEREVDPEGVLAAEERARRAASARRAYFAALALKSAQARRRRTA
jgi:hypothetical protein